MATIKISVTDSEKEWLQYMADLHDLSLSDLLKKYSIEQLEDEYDIQMAEIAHKKYLEDNKETVDIRNVLDDFIM